MHPGVTVRLFYLYILVFGATQARVQDVHSFQQNVHNGVGFIHTYESVIHGIPAVIH